MTRKIPRNYTEARTLADDARDRAFARVDKQRTLEQNYRDVENAKPAHRRRDISTPFSVAVDRRLKNDFQFNSAVADNRWYIDYAVMYAQGEQLALLTTIVQLLELQLNRDGARDITSTPTHCQHHIPPIHVHKH